MLQWQFTPFVIPLFIATALLILLALYAWLHSNARGAISSLWLMLALAVWSFFYAFELMGQNPSTIILVRKLKYIGIVSVPPLLLIFALDYTNHRFRLSRGHLAWIFLVPCCTLLLTWTNEFHGLVMKHEVFLWDGPLLRLDRTPGVWFWVHTVYSYIVLFVGSFLLMRVVLQQAPLYRWQAIVILTGIIIPWVSNFLFIFHLTPHPHLDLTPLAFSWTGLVIVGGLLRFRLLDLVPLARDTIVQTMSDGIIVLDSKNRIVDINPAAEKVISASDKRFIGTDIRQYFSTVEGSFFPDDLQDEIQFEITSDLAGGQTYFDVRISHVYSPNGFLLGRVVVLRDITYRKMTEKRLHTLAITDPLTGLFNRRYFFHLAEQHFQQAIRSLMPLSLLMIDLDHFKEVNDQYGHTIGDQVLKEVSRILEAGIRSADVLARYGGEEFIILNPNTSLENAYLGAERLRRLISTHEYQVENNTISITLSIGVATLDFEVDSSLDDLIVEADRALYVAKQSGRNRVVSYEREMENCACSQSYLG